MSDVWRCLLLILLLLLLVTLGAVNFLLLLQGQRDRCTGTDGDQGSTSAALSAILLLYYKYCCYSSLSSRIFATGRKPVPADCFTLLSLLFPLPLHYSNPLLIFPVYLSYCYVAHMRLQLYKLSISKETRAS